MRFDDVTGGLFVAVLIAGLFLLVGDRLAYVWPIGFVYAVLIPLFANRFLQLKDVRTASPESVNVLKSVVWPIVLGLGLAWAYAATYPVGFVVGEYLPESLTVMRAMPESFTPGSSGLVMHRRVPNEAMLLVIALGLCLVAVASTYATYRAMAPGERKDPNIRLRSMP